MAEDVKAELEVLREKLKDLEIKSQIKQPQVYIKSERKIPKLAGRPVKDTDPEVDDWIYDMKEHLSTIPTDVGKVEFVLDHLIGGAKTEVRLRPQEMKQTADNILQIIEDTYKSQDTLAQMKHKFYERVQKENESLESYSLTLMKMLRSISRKEGGELPNREKILTEKFVDGVQDPQLKRELRKYSLENPKLPFIEFRARILMWVDDQQPKVEKTVAVKKLTVEKESQSDEILKMLHKQQEILVKQQQQIEMLTQLTQQSRQTIPYQVPNRGIYRGRGRGRGRRPFGRTNSSSVIICYNCKAEGHKRNECPLLQQSDSTATQTNDPNAQPSQ